MVRRVKECDLQAKSQAAADHAKHFSVGKDCGVRSGMIDAHETRGLAAGQEHRQEERKVRKKCIEQQVQPLDSETTGIAAP